MGDGADCVLFLKFIFTAGAGFMERILRGEVTFGGRIGFYVFFIWEAVICMGWELGIQEERKEVVIEGDEACFM